MHDVDLDTTLDDTPGCTTLHGVLPSRDGLEALVLVTPVAAQVENILITARLLHHLAAAPWRAKDVLWVAPNASCDHAWVQRYMDSDVAMARGGALQQAVVLQV